MKNLNKYMIKQILWNMKMIRMNKATHSNNKKIKSVN